MVPLLLRRVALARRVPPLAVLRVVPAALRAALRAVLAAFCAGVRLAAARVLRARVVAAFFAAVLRLVAARLRVAAAFCAAALRLPGPPVTRSSSSAASARRSATEVCTTFGVALPPLLAASAMVRATRLRSPRARSISNNSSCLLFLATDPP
ncbi:MAG: hypothetical protein QOE08_2121 [Thermoleophilaceae bacterium]|nr:hypothetical protein [Thermoleophilaceae bacterium]